jgi:hypothetical protein
MIKVFEIILCMYLKTISPDVPRFTFVCSIYVWLFKKNIMCFIYFYPAMTAFTDQYSLPNIFFDIGQMLTKT